MYIDTFEQYLKYLDTIMDAIHDTVDNLENKDTYNRIELLQTLRGIGFLSAVVLIAEMGSFDLFTSPKNCMLILGLILRSNNLVNFRATRSICPSENLL